LCPVDFSDTALQALREAVALARTHHADVKALHVLPGRLPPLSGLAVAAAGFLETGTRETHRSEDMQGRLREFVAAVEDGVPVEAVVEEGRVVDQIASQASARDVDLVVMGTHGHSGFENLTLGSTTDKALRKVRCPVLTVPPADAETPRGAFSKVVCAVDFSPSARRALECALSLGEEGERELVLVHALESLPGRENDSVAGPALAGFDASGYRLALEDAARGRLRTLLPPEASGWRVVEEVSAGRAHEQVLEAAKRHAADLIAIGVHGGDSLEHTLSGSTAYNVARRARCPVLTARAA
jgi:nucleotide-binding universal stress UspA family protein